MHTITLFFTFWFLTTTTLHSQEINTAKADSLYSAGNWANALNEYREIIRSPNLSLSSSIWNKVGYAAHQTGNYPEAMSYYQKALENEPPQALLPFILSRMAKTESRMGNTEASIKYLIDAIKAGYINTEELNEHSDFLPIRNNPDFDSLKKDLNKRVNPCITDPVRQQLDFWIGSWNVYITGTKYLAGTNTIVKEAAGCTLHESWVSATGGETGVSLTYYDQSAGFWEQTYVANNSNITVYRDGVFTGNSMVFKFKAKRRGKEITGKFTLERISSTEIRQYQEESTDNGTTWKRTFDFTYKKQGK